MYMAHVRKVDREKQTLKEHLLGTQKIAECLGSKLGLKHVAGLAGLLHDLGKYSDRFQLYIYQAIWEPNNAEFKRGDVDHATAGGRLLFELYHSEDNTPYEKLLAEIVGNAIISHHANLHDYISPKSESDFLKRIKEKSLPEYELAVERFFTDTITDKDFRQYVVRAVEELKQFTDHSPTQSFFVTKYIFSCLIDADRTNTRHFDEQAHAESPLQYQLLFEKYYQKLLNHLMELKVKSNACEPINLLRTKMSEQCDSFAERPSGIYTLSIPTGGGKTLASLRYALKHAQKYDKHRIIYIVPFTTIIEQNAQEIRNILDEDEYILEHHSNVIMEDEGDRSNGDEQDDGLITKKERLKLARDNWDSPIIFTTLVQFLNIFYAKGNRNTRRLHNLTHSVLIFDEVQQVPTKCVSLFNEALNFLKTFANSSVLLCTATQPTLEKVNHSLLKNRDGEIVENLNEVTQAFKRVEIVDKSEKALGTKDLAKWIKENIEIWGNVLIILNTKSVVKNLYKELKEESVPVFHLSTSMAAAHRKDQLKKIRGNLERKTPFICVTTQLIEAGVDVSFKCVIRSLTGLGSIAQAAGRCNRHGEEALQHVYVIDHKEERLSKLKEIEIGKGISKNIFASFKKKPDKYGGELISQAAMRKYFLAYYHKMDVDLNYYVREVEKDMTKLLMSMHKENSYVLHYQKKNNKVFPLLLNSSCKTATDYFRVIDDGTTTVLVPYGAGKDIIAELNSDEWIDDISKTLKQAQQYTVNLYPQQMRELIKAGAIIVHLDGMVYELKEGWYSDEYGVDDQGEGGMEFMSF
ncbi:CRISPR-associated helicase/endonuclease Cas3 [Amphibacillus sediminis]|uniref:CRISPR-associated helicase/endonuclease Cas3 n=1 Tax=Amphibacillus sediminis TaxID=360185 RepID=UPI00082E9F7D|nr:CRISPR-associated helicase/endonuclease Cas3 [Amphibacillus sediminis]